jgi:hypothetical protein
MGCGRIAQTIMQKFGEGPHGKSILAWVRHAQVQSSPSNHYENSEGTMKHPGKAASVQGTKLKRGAAVQVMCYPRPQTKAVIVEASRKANRSLSSFMILASLKEAAAIRGVTIAELIPTQELEQYC